MLGTDALASLAERVKYKPGWSFRVEHADILQGPYLFIQILVENAYEPDGDKITLYVNSPVPPMDSPFAFWNWLVWRIKQVEIHEVMEFFRVDGEIYMDPHEELR